MRRRQIARVYAGISRGVRADAADAAPGLAGSPPAKIPRECAEQLLVLHVLLCQRPVQVAEISISAILLRLGGLKAEILEEARRSFDEFLALALRRRKSASCVVLP